MQCSLRCSQAGRGDHRNDSDIDSGARWEHDVPEVWDVTVPDGVGVVALNTAPLELAGRIALDGSRWRVSLRSRGSLDSEILRERSVWRYGDR